MKMSDSKESRKEEEWLKETKGMDRVTNEKD